MKARMYPEALFAQSLVDLVDSFWWGDMWFYVLVLFKNEKKTSIMGRGDTEPLVAGKAFGFVDVLILSFLCDFDFL